MSSGNGKQVGPAVSLRWSEEESFGGRSLRPIRGEMFIGHAIDKI